MINIQKVIKKEAPIWKEEWDGWLRDTPYGLYQTYRIPQLTNIEGYNRKVDVFYSQLSQDLWVARHFKGKQEGFYLEVECEDSVHESNS